MRIRGLGKRLASRRLRTGALLVAALLALGAVASNASPVEGLLGERARAVADKDLQKALRATRAQETGEYAIMPIGVEGSFDRAVGSHQTDYDYYDPDTDEDFVERLILVDGMGYSMSDYSKGDECWFDFSAYSYPGYGDDGPEVTLLVESLKGESGSGHTIEATVPVGLLADAFYGSDPTEKPSDDRGSPRAVRVPVTVRIGVETVATIKVEMKTVLAMLKERDVGIEDAFGKGVDTEFLADQDSVQIVLSKYGFPVTIERPLPWDMGLGEDDKC